MKTMPTIQSVSPSVNKPAIQRHPSAVAAKLNTLYPEAAFTPLSRQENVSRYPLNRFVKMLSGITRSVSLPANYLDKIPADCPAGIHTLNKTLCARKPGVYDDLLMNLCAGHKGELILVQQRDYLHTIKTQLPSAYQDIKNWTGVCLGLSVIWLLGRHCNMSDKQVLNNMLGYDADQDRLTSPHMAEAGVNKIYAVQDKFQLATVNKVKNDQRFKNISGPVLLYEKIKQISKMAKMPVVNVRDESPFVLLNYREELGQNILNAVLQDNRTQQLLLMSHSHCMAIYTNGRDQYAFFEPNTGMFSYTDKADFGKFMDELGPLLGIRQSLLVPGSQEQLMVMELGVE